MRGVPSLQPVNASLDGNSRRLKRLFDVLLNRAISEQQVSLLFQLTNFDITIPYGVAVILQQSVAPFGLTRTLWSI
jgi:hypothetical protein